MPSDPDMIAMARHGGTEARVIDKQGTHQKVVGNNSITIPQVTIDTGAAKTACRASHEVQTYVQPVRALVIRKIAPLSIVEHVRRCCRSRIGPNDPRHSNIAVVDAKSRKLQSTLRTLAVVQRDDGATSADRE
jgi:hypothetical protein